MSLQRQLAEQQARLEQSEKSVEIIRHEKRPTKPQQSSDDMQGKFLEQQMEQQMNFKSEAQRLVVASANHAHAIFRRLDER